MKAEHLRIGNLFNPYVPVAVEPWMLQPGAKVQFIPIPLTEEWLLNFGFIKVGWCFRLPISPGLELLLICILN